MREWARVVRPTSNGRRAAPYRQPSTTLADSQPDEWTTPTGNGQRVELSLSRAHLPLIVLPPDCWPVEYPSHVDIPPPVSAFSFKQSINVILKGIKPKLRGQDNVKIVLLNRWSIIGCEARRRHPLLVPFSWAAKPCEAGSSFSCLADPQST